MITHCENDNQKKVVARIVGSVSACVNIANALLCTIGIHLQRTFLTSRFSRRGLYLLWPPSSSSSSHFLSSHLAYRQINSPICNTLSYLYHSLNIHMEFPSMRHLNIYLINAVRIPETYNISWIKWESRQNV